MGSGRGKILTHLNVSIVAGLYYKLDLEPAWPSVVASGAAEPCEMVVLVAAPHELVVVGNEFWGGDHFLCAVIVGAVDPLDLPQVFAALEKVYAPFIYLNHSIKVSPAIDLSTTVNQT